ncbi:MAG: F0F1 ATP synthase subunit epsilon [candidate division KSB1 bacterium]|nr:F0F1 ATP synthase subunit epsilon [candidate division KSB1 bacterium]MDZ7273058.1 F0F1 ATP synthase subunit epsilon [candidate division KSB1 bacterium]MDZ7285161.1 F0F1 ATP synthase subunit epsilon [candidate division KSB1 bacterium]MDZ7298193.1 F0F1 ATP synthase subunit epsilon [candidate division KSB1 bacterium]MDZ7307858.1 F0F1 ATP synthase subunit epsilon [candidate division KSB1 bacterium]
MATPKSFPLEIVTPTSRVFAAQVNALVAPGEAGYFGVLPHHTNLLATLKIGYLKVRIADQTKYFAISGGIAEVTSGGVKILAEAAEPAAAIDVERARRAKERAQRRLHEGRKQWDVARAQAALARATNRLKVVELMRV